MPTLGELSATIGELSATIREISSDIEDSESAELPTVEELSATTEELPTTTAEISSSKDAGSSAAEMPAAVTMESQTNIHSIHQPDMLSQEQLEHWSGYKLVGDNIDKNFRRSFQRHDKKTISMHAFHMYAVKDRVDFSSHSDIAPAAAHVDVTKLLIGEAQIVKLNKDVTVLLSR